MEERGYNANFFPEGTAGALNARRTVGGKARVSVAN